MSLLNNSYNELLETLGESNEVIGSVLECEFITPIHATLDSTKFIEDLDSEVVNNRKVLELDYYNKIFYDMVHDLAEMKFYSEVNLNTTRRLIATNNDCLSLVNVQIRDAIHVQAYFRSSDIITALPCDLEFLACLPGRLKSHFEEKQGVIGYEEITEEFLSEYCNKPVKLKIMFGSLHKNSGY